MQLKILNPFYLYIYGFDYEVLKSLKLRKGIWGGIKPPHIMPFSGMSPGAQMSFQILFFLHCTTSVMQSNQKSRLISLMSCLISLKPEYDYPSFITATHNCYQSFMSRSLLTCFLDHIWFFTDLWLVTEWSHFCLPCPQAWILASLSISLPDHSLSLCDGCEREMPAGLQISAMGPFPNASPLFGWEHKVCDFH